MLFDEKDGFNANDVARRIANLIRLGTIKEVNYTKAKARVQIGNLLTDWLPWITQCAGNTINWCPIETNEQVIVLATTGDLCQGVILGSLYRCNAPSTSPVLYTMYYRDGSTISFDTATSTLTASIRGDINIQSNGNANLNINGDVSIRAGGDIKARAKSIRFTSPSIKLDGNVTITGNLSSHGKMTLSGEGAPVARLGDTVQVDPNTHRGTITSGSSKVTAG